MLLIFSNFLPLQYCSMYLVTCPDCLEQVDIKTFKLHEAQLCSNRVITCPNAGCSVKLHAINLKRHLQDECVISQHRRNLLQQADLRLKQQQEQERQRENEARQREAQMLAKLHAENAARAQLSQSTLPSSTSAGQEPEQSPEPVQEIPAASICSQCGEGVRESQLAVHMRSHCHFRLIMCPHFGNGCDNERVPYALINEHLRDDCDAEKVRAILIQKSRLRQELVQCATCGVKVSSNQASLFVILNKESSNYLTKGSVNTRRLIYALSFAWFSLL